MQFALVLLFVFFLGSLSGMGVSCRTLVQCKLTWRTQKHGMLLPAHLFSVVARLHGVAEWFCSMGLPCESTASAAVSAPAIKIGTIH